MSEREAAKAAQAWFGKMLRVLSKDYSTFGQTVAPSTSTTVVQDGDVGDISSFIVKARPKRKSYLWIDIGEYHRQQVYQESRHNDILGGLHHLLPIFEWQVEVSKTGDAHYCGYLHDVLPLEAYQQDHNWVEIWVDDDGFEAALDVVDGMDEDDEEERSGDSVAIAYLRCEDMPGPHESVSRLIEQPLAKAFLAGLRALVEAQ